MRKKIRAEIRKARTVKKEAAMGIELSWEIWSGGEGVLKWEEH